MKQRLLTSLFSLFAIIALGQNQSNQATWTILIETEEVLFESKEVRCFDIQEGIDQQKVIIRVTNKTNETLAISWLNALYYDGKCLTCNNPSENTYTLELTPLQAKEGVCNSYDKSLVVFSSDNKKFIPSILTDLKIHSLTNINKPKN